MRQALHAEWTKLRTVPGNGWLLLACVALTVALSITAAATVICPSTGRHLDPARVSLTGIDLGQAVVVILAVLAMSGEYSSGMIRVTLAAMPRRITVMGAKAAIVTGAVLATGSIAVLASVLAGQFILPGHGLSLSLADGSVLRAAAGSVLYLALIGLMSLGVVTAVRDAAVAIGVVLALLYLFPIFAQVVTDPDWQQRLQQIGPMTAGLAIQATIGLHSLPISPWGGLGVLAAWAVAALMVGGLLLWLRDA
jgi:ABC-2 type transport system permease protein